MNDSCANPGFGGYQKQTLDRGLIRFIMMTQASESCSLTKRALLITDSLEAQLILATGHLFPYEKRRGGLPWRVRRCRPPRWALRALREAQGVLV